MSYFQICLKVIYYIKNMITIKWLWLDGGKFFQIATMLEHFPFYMDMKISYISNKWWIYASMSTFCLFSIENGIRQAYNGSIQQPWFNEVTAVLATVARVHSNLISCCGYMLQLLIVYALHKVAKRFSETVGISKQIGVRISWNQIDSQLTSIRNLADKINDLISSMTTCFVILLVLYFAVETEKEMSNDEQSDWISALELTLFMVFGVLLLILMADVSNKMGQIKNWFLVSENRNQVQPPCHLAVILHQLEFNGVAVKASNVFPITFGVAASVSYKLKKTLLVFFN